MQGVTSGAIHGASEGEIEQAEYHNRAKCAGDPKTHHPGGSQGQDHIVLHEATGSHRRHPLLSQEAFPHIQSHKNRQKGARDTGESESERWQCLTIDGNCEK